MPAGYYPVQSVTINGGEVKNAQSCSVDFSAAKKPVYTFGQLLPKSTIQTEIAQVTLNVVAALSDGTWPYNIKFDESEIKKSTGFACKVDVGGGTIELKNCYLQSVGMNASAGDVPTATLSVIGSSASYTLGAPKAISNFGTPDLTISGPVEVSIGSAKVGKSFSFTASVDREPVVPLGIKLDDDGELQKLNWIIKGLKVRVEAEVFVVDGVSGPALNKTSEITAKVKGKSYGYKEGTVNVLKSNLSTDGVGTVTYGVDEDIIKISNVSCG